MKHRFPGWFPYLLLGVLGGITGACTVAILGSEAIYGVGAYVTLGLLAAAVCALAWSFLYAIRYSVQVRPEGVLITGAFRIRTIPLDSIAQVITASAPRSGTDSWLLDKDDTCLAKLAGSLVGFEVLLVELGQALRPYQVLFYRRENFGPWQMQVAGDSHWVPYEAPRFARKSGRRMMIATVFALLLIVIAVMLSRR